MPEGMEGLDARAYARNRIANLAKEFAWSEASDDQWCEALRARLREVIGLPTERVPLNPETLNSEAFAGYRRDTVTFSSREGLRVFGYLLVPENLTAPAPAIVCIPGHGNGVDCIVGIEPDDYQNDFAIQSVQVGFMTLAIEPIGFGHRKAAADRDRYSSCNGDSMAALVLGETMIAWRVHDALIALDYLSLLPNVNPKELGMMGISGGGLVAFWAACLDERVAATVVSGYFNTFFDSILGIDHCVDNYAPEMAKVVEMPDMAALIAPRKLFVESGIQDHIFPIEAFRGACEKAQRIYLDSDSFQSHEFEGGHEFNGTQALPQMKKWLA